MSQYRSKKLVALELSECLPSVTETPMVVAAATSTVMGEYSAAPVLSPTGNKNAPGTAYAFRTRPLPVATSILADENAPAMVDDAPKVRTLPERLRLPVVKVNTPVTDA